MKMRLEILKIQFLHIIYKGPALGPLTKWSIQKIRAKREFFELTISLPQGPLKEPFIYIFNFLWIDE